MLDESGTAEAKEKRRHSAFKVIPRVQEGNWVVKQAVGSTPALLGHKLVTKYFRCAYARACELQHASGIQMVVCSELGSFCMVSALGTQIASLVPAGMCGGQAVTAELARVVLSQNFACSLIVCEQLCVYGAGAPAIWRWIWMWGPLVLLRTWWGSCLARSRAWSLTLLLFWRAVHRCALALLSCMAASPAVGRFVCHLLAA